MIGAVLDHPLLCAFLVTAAGYGIAAAALWPWRGDR